MSTIWGTLARRWRPAPLRSRLSSTASPTPRLPLLDLHRHLDGNIRTSTIFELGKKNGVKLPAATAEELRPFVQVTRPLASLVEFFEKFEYNSKVLATYDDVFRVAYENLEDAKKEGLAYVELRFSPAFMATGNGLQPLEVVDAVIDGVTAGCKDTGVRANLIGIITRQFGDGSVEKEFSAILARKDKLVGIDLAGDEAGVPGRTFKRHFERARGEGVRITVHAGEAAGPESVRDAITILGAERIGHGIRSIEDPSVVDLLVERNIGLEVCLTSNVHTGAVASLADHPAKQLLQRGVKLSLNTDDPGVSGIDMPHELTFAAVQAGLSVDAVERTIKNGWDMAFLSTEEKREILGRWPL